MFDIAAALNDGRRVGLAERELSFRMKLAEAGQIQQLREYEERRAAERAIAEKETTLNKLAAMYIGAPRASPFSDPSRSRIAALMGSPSTPNLSVSTSNAAPDSASMPQPLSSGPGAHPPGAAKFGAAVPRQAASSLNWGNLDRNEMMRAMIEADPKRAQEIQSWGDEQWRNEALRDYRRVEQIFGSSTPRLLAERIAPDLLEGLAEEGYSWQDLTDDHVRTLSQAFMSELAPLAGIDMNSALETVVGQDGRPVLVPRSQAAGKQPYDKGSQPSSYDEFVLTQNDPEFAAFLRSRRGRGISITQPDGSVIQIGGDGGAIGPGELVTPVRNDLQQTIVAATDELDRLNSIGEGFDPRFLQVPGRLRAAGIKVKDMAGGYFGELSPEESAYLQRFSAFKADAAKNLSMILNRLSGAAISPAEAERLKKGIPNDEDSPTEFVSKYRASVKDSTRSVMRANWALKNGIGVQSVERLSQTMPLHAIDQVYEQRANEIWQQLGGTPESKQQAIRQANQEFGVAR